jgi:hypothetical protein
MKWAFRHVPEYYSPQNISTIKYLFIKKCLENYNNNLQENFSQPSIIDARARYGAAARRLRNTALDFNSQMSAGAQPDLTRIGRPSSKSFLKHTAFTYTASSDMYF